MCGELGAIYENLYKKIFILDFCLYIFFSHSVVVEKKKHWAKAQTILFNNLAV